MKAEILRLFKGFLGEKSDTINQEALAYGLLIPATAPADVVNEAIKQYGKDGDLWNQTFHKSWDKVANAPIMQLILEQLIHYFTTYGFEELGIYDASTVYIPAEKLEVPELKVDKIKLVPINALTEDEMKAKLMLLVTSGIALSDQTVKDIKVLSDFIDKDRFDEVSNREVRTFLYDKYNIMPRNPEAFLRYLIFKATGATLKIQNVATYKALQASDKALVLRMLEAYGDYTKLSSIFLRNKNLFLALKTKDINTTETIYKKVDKYHVKAAKTVSKTSNKEAARVNTIVNKLRKLAVENHKALKPAVLDNITNEAFVMSEQDIINALENVTLFRAIRVLNALAYKLNGTTDIVYRVRNGKSFVSTTDVRNRDLLIARYQAVRTFIATKFQEKVGDKLVYIPEGTIYKAPTSEKQFVGNVPEGSYFELPDGKNLIVAVHWTNFDNKGYDSRIDLDFHMQDDRGGNYGWCYNYRSGDKGILFSGDVVDAPAPKGATEAYYIANKVRDLNANLTLNSYNVSGRDIPFELIVAEGKRFENDCCSRDAAKSNHLIDPNKIITKFNMVMKGTDGQRQINLGMIKADQKTKRFYLSNYAVGVQGAVTVRGQYTEGALRYAKAYNEVQTTLNELLVSANAKVITTPTVEVTKPEAYIDEAGKPQIKYTTETVTADIDLSIENIDKTSIIELLSK